MQRRTPVFEEKDISGSEKTKADLVTTGSKSLRRADRRRQGQAGALTAGWQHTGIMQTAGEEIWANGSRCCLRRFLQRPTSGFSARSRSGMGSGSYAAGLQRLI